jgi:hypothetical protein
MGAHRRRQQRAAAKKKEREVRPVAKKPVKKAKKGK